MPDLPHWALFLSATLVLLITPGPSIMYVVSRSVALGWRAGVLSSAGLALGDLLQVIATALGLAVVLVSAPRLFVAMKLTGALYLMGIGIATLMGKGARVNGKPEQSRPAVSSRSLILQGFAALNPKTLLFLAAFLPQFTSPQAGSLRIQIAVFGIVFVVVGFVTNSVFGFIGGKVAASSGQRFQLASRFVGGALLIALGVVAALTPNPRA